MDLLFHSLALVAAILVILLLGVWVSTALFIVGFFGLTFVANAEAGKILATQVWSASTTWALTALPLFIWMGEILLRTELARNLFRGLSPLCRRIPGRLMQVNVIGSALFASVCGSSTATCAIIGRMSYQELSARGYNSSMLLGSIACASTLGIMIPPSIVMIVYGVAADVSIPRLFIAGIVPGLILAFMFSSYIAIRAWLKPIELPSESKERDQLGSLKDFLHIIPFIALVVALVATIYAGYATATEAAAVGVAAALALSAAYKQLNWANFRESLSGAVKTTSMIMLILLAASYLNISMGFTGFPRQLASSVADLMLTQYALIALLTLLFVILGCFLDGLSIILLSTSIMMPMVGAAGIDPIWFGVYLVLVVEIGMITPPVGFNLFVLHSVTGARVGEIAHASFPFFLIMLMFVAVLTLWPELATFLPKLMMG